MIAQITSYFHKKTFRTKITFFIFVLLLFWRMVIAQSIAIFQWQISTLIESIFICLLYGLISVVIWLNADDLPSLNIDKNFIVIFVFVGLFYSVNLSFFLPLGIFLVITALINRFYLFSGEVQLKSVPLNLWQNIILIMIFLTPLFIPFIWLKTSVKWPDSTAIYTAIFTANLPMVIFEEVIFRGLLWMFLMRANLKEYQIIFIQALLFWLSHLYYYFSAPYTFWFALPFGSILLGLIVWRSKTITSSCMGHYINNFLVKILQVTAGFSR